jgi:hypothetical protein
VQKAGVAVAVQVWLVARAAALFPSFPWRIVGAMFAGKRVLKARTIESVLLLTHRTLIIILELSWRTLKLHYRKDVMYTGTLVGTGNMGHAPPVACSAVQVCCRSV